MLLCLPGYKCNKTPAEREKEQRDSTADRLGKEIMLGSAWGDSFKTIKFQ